MILVEPWKYDLIVDLLENLGASGDPEKAIEKVQKMQDALEEIETLAQPKHPYGDERIYEIARKARWL